MKLPVNLAVLPMSRKMRVCQTPRCVSDSVLCHISYYTYVVIQGCQIGHKLNQTATKQDKYGAFLCSTYEFIESVVMYNCKSCFIRIYISILDCFIIRVITFSTAAASAETVFNMDDVIDNFILCTNVNVVLFVVNLAPM